MIYALNMIVFSTTLVLIGIALITGLVGNLEDPDAGKSVFN